MTDYMKEAERLPELHRETVDDALEVVDTFGPWGMDINEDLRRQIVLADEVRQLRKLYSAAVKGRQDMRTALRDTRAALKAALTPSSGNAEAERLIEEYGDAVSDVVGFAQDPAGYSSRVESTRAALLAHIQRGAVPEGRQVVPMPEPVARILEWRGRLALSPQPSARTFDEFPTSETFPAKKDAYWSDGKLLVLADEARTYGDAREAAGYARGRAEAKAKITSSLAATVECEMFEAVIHPTIGAALRGEVKP